MLLAVLSLRERREWRVRQGLEAKDSEWIEASMSEVGALVGLSAHSVRTALDTPALRGILRYQPPSPHAHKTDGRGMCPGRWLVTPNALTPADAAALEQALTERDALHDFVGAAERLMAEKGQAAKLLPMLWRVRGWKRGRREGVPTWPASQEDREKAAKGARPITVMDVVRSAAGKHGMDDVELGEIARLDNWYVGGTKTRFGLIAEAELVRWVRELGPGRAVLLLLLRRMAESGRAGMRGERGAVLIPGGSRELAAALGLSQQDVDLWLANERLRDYLSWERRIVSTGKRKREWSLICRLEGPALAGLRGRERGERRGDLEQPDSLSASDLEQPASLSRGDLKKPASLSASDLKKPDSLSASDLKKPASLSRGDLKKPASLSASDLKKPDSLSQTGLSENVLTDNYVECASEKTTSGSGKTPAKIEAVLNISGGASPVELLKEVETAFRTDVEPDQPSLEATPQNGGAGWVGLNDKLSGKREKTLGNPEDAEEENENAKELGEEEDEDWEEDEGPELGEEWERDEEESAWNLKGLLKDCYEVNRDALITGGVSAEQWVGLLLQYSASTKVQKPFALAIRRLMENARLRPDVVYAELGKLPPGRLLKLLTPWQWVERGLIGPEYIARVRVEEETPAWKEAMRGLSSARCEELRGWLEPGILWLDGGGYGPAGRGETWR